MADQARSSQMPSAHHDCAPPRIAAGGGTDAAVDDIDDTLDRLVAPGAELVSNEVVKYETSYRLVLHPGA